MLSQHTNSNLPSPASDVIIGDTKYPMTPYFKKYFPAPPQAMTVIPSIPKSGQAQLFSWHPANATFGDSFFDVPSIDISHTQFGAVYPKRKKLIREVL